MNMAAVREKLASFAPSFKRNSTERRRNGLYALFRKELADHLLSKRLLIIFLLFLLVTTASLVGGVSNLAENMTEDTEFVFLKLFTTGSGSVYSFATFLAFLGPLAGITLGFDAVTSERSQGTLNRLASQPIYRDSILNAKFLAGTAVIFLLVFVLGGYISGVGLIRLAFPPSFEEVLCVLVFLLLAGVYLPVWMALAVILSVVCRHGATAALICISVWLFLSLFMSLVASGIANAVYPLDGFAGLMNVESNYNLTLALNRISPYYLFSEAASTILNPNVRSIGVVTASQASGAVASSLPLEQSLLLIWPHLVVMIALALLGFAAAYVVFMRQELRA